MPGLFANKKLGFKYRVAIYFVWHPDAVLTPPQVAEIFSLHITDVGARMAPLIEHGVITTTEIPPAEYLSREGKPGRPLRHAYCVGPELRKFTV